MKSPFFIIGSPRSGTTLLRLILTTHEAIVVPPECGFMLWLRSEFDGWTGVDFAIPEKRDQLASRIVGARKFETWGLSSEEIVDGIAKASPANYAGVCETVYRLWGSRQGKLPSIWGDKNNYYLSHIDTLKELYPSARFLHIVRDGRDVACSYREVMTLHTSSPYRPTLPIEIGQIAERWSNDIRAIGDQLGRLSSDDVLELRYEDLARHPGGEIGRVCEWLGIVPEPQMLSFHKLNRKRALEPAATMDWKVRTLDPVNAATVGRYRSLLSEGEIEEFESIAGMELGEYGYLGRGEDWRPSG